MAKGITKQKVERRHSKEERNGPVQGSAMNGIDGGLHPAVDGQSEVT